MILKFTRNLHTGIRSLDENLFLARCRIEDTFWSAEVALEVRLPDLEIVKTEGRVENIRQESGASEVPDLSRVVGVRIGSGLNKIIRELLGEEGEGIPWGHLILEACEGVVLAITAEEFDRAGYFGGQANPPAAGQAINPVPIVFGEEARKAMAEYNPRLKGSCIAFHE